MRAQTFEYHGQRITLDQPGWYCTACEEGVHEGADIAATDRVFAEFKARVDGVLGPADIRRIRLRLGLSQRKASELLGGGPHAFQKYESGAAAVSLAMSNLLRLLEQDPQRVREIEVANAPARRQRRAP